MLCTEIVSDIQNIFLYTTCSPHVLQKRRAYEKDLPVPIKLQIAIEKPSPNQLHDSECKL